MKRLKLFAAAAILLIVAACSGQNGYNPDKCLQLKEMIENNEKLSDGDYTAMATQLLAILKDMQAMKDEAGDDHEALTRLMNKEEMKGMLDYALSFGFYLQSHQAEVPASASKILDQAKADGVGF